jgi:hypothetical protein
MSKRNFVGIRYIETKRQGKTTIALGMYADSKLGKISFAGASEKNPEDRENTLRGRNLAIARAFKNLGREIEKREWDKIKANYATKVAKEVHEESAPSVQENKENPKVSKRTKVVKSTHE